MLQGKESIIQALWVLPHCRLNMRPQVLNEPVSVASLLLFSRWVDLLTVVRRPACIACPSNIALLLSSHVWRHQDSLSPNPLWSPHRPFRCQSSTFFCRLSCFIPSYSVSLLLLLGCRIFLYLFMHYLLAKRAKEAGDGGSPAP